MTEREASREGSFRCAVILALLSITMIAVEGGQAQRSVSGHSVGASLGASSIERHGMRTPELAVAGPYRIYAGNTHAHTQFTWSHGYQWSHAAGCMGNIVYEPERGNPFVSTWAPQQGKESYDKNESPCPAIYVIGASQYPAPGMMLKENWQELQGLPAKHFELAKKAGFDFYATTDHSEEAPLSPAGPANPAWTATKEQARTSTTADFVALAGFEYSAHDGPGLGDHINVFNSNGILDAIAPDVNLRYLYSWLESARPNGSGPVVASFNHPEPDQNGNWAYRDPRITNIITMLEVVNGNDNIHYDGFVRALDAGWKVSPVCGLDNHNTTGITSATSRTFVLAGSRTKLSILDAMAHRRTYASLDTNLHASYSVNGIIMGSTLDRPTRFRFDILVSDEDLDKPGDRITKIDIVKDHGEVAQSYLPPSPDHELRWTPTITDSKSRYFFVRIWSASGGDAKSANPSAPVAWLAPVWTGR